MKCKFTAIASLLLATPVMASNFYAGAALGYENIKQTFTITANDDTNGYKIANIDKAGLKQRIFVGYSFDFAPGLSVELDFTNFSDAKNPVKSLFTRNGELNKDGAKTEQNKINSTITGVSLQNSTFLSSPYAGLPVPFNQFLDTIARNNILKMHSIGLSAVYTFPTKEMLIPFFGFRAGLNHHEFTSKLTTESNLVSKPADNGITKYEVKHDQKTVKKTDVSLGATFGLKVNIVSNLDIFVSYNYTRVNTDITTRGVNAGISYRF